MSFKIGDKVRYVGTNSKYRGHEGVIVEVYQWKIVALEGGHWPSGQAWIAPKPESMELIEEITIEI